MPDNRYNAIFFDLDGTLLPMEVEVFLKGYFEALGAFATEYGYESESFCRAAGTSINMMGDHEPGVLNSQAFWSHLEREWGECGEREKRFFDEFYEGPFGGIGTGCAPNPAAARAINALVEKGYPLYLTTMPLFPRSGVEWRLRWAGVDPAAFDRITVYDNSTATKPSLNYYQENIDLVGFDPSTILMVGNNTVEDMVAMELGMDAFLVTDYIINPNGFDVESVKHGSLEEFADFAEQLPDYHIIKGN